MLEESSEEEPGGLYHQGFGLEIQGYPHRKHTHNQASVYLDKSSKFRIRLSNTNDFMTMTSVFVDGVDIGKVVHCRTL
jgi:hypothetical protein